jgi:hypothetical protein
MQPDRPQEVSALPSPDILRALAGILGFVCLVLLIAPGLLARAAAHAGIELELQSWQIRVVAGVGLVLTTVVRAALGGGSRSSLESALTDLAPQTGGSYSMERMRPSSPDSEGGPTVRWAVQGTPVSLSCNRAGRKAASTRCAAEVRLARPFQFVAVPRNGFTKLLSSPAMWGFILNAAKKQAGAGDSSDREEGVERLAFLATPEVALIDPDLQRSMILKSDDSSLAREYIGGAGLHARVLDFQKACRGWQMSLLQVDRAGNSRLLVEAPGVETRPEALRAAYDLMAAAVVSLRDRGLLKSGESAPSAAA